MSHSLATGSGEEGHVRRYVELGTIPNCVDGGFDVLHAAIRMPADVDSLRLFGAVLSRHQSLDSRRSQSMSDTLRAEHKCPVDTAAGHQISSYAGRSKQHFIRN